MTHEEILKPHISSINYMGLALQVVIKDDALKAMAEATEFWVKQWNYAQEQLAAKDKEIQLLNVEIDGIGSMLLSVQQESIQCKKDNTEMFIHCTNWKKLVAEKHKEIADNKTKHQLQLDLQWVAAKSLETERDFLLKEIAELKFNLLKTKEQLLESLKVQLSHNNNLLP